MASTMSVYGKECERLPRDKALHVQCIVSEMYQFYAHVKALAHESPSPSYCDCLNKMPDVNRMTCSHILEWAHATIAHRWMPSGACTTSIEDQLNSVSTQSAARMKCHASLNTLECLL